MPIPADYFPATWPYRSQDLSTSCGFWDHETSAVHILVTPVVGNGQPFQALHEVIDSAFGDTQRELDENSTYCSNLARDWARLHPIAIAIRSRVNALDEHADNLETQPATIETAAELGDTITAFREINSLYEQAINGCRAMGDTLKARTDFHEHLQMLLECLDTVKKVAVSLDSINMECKEGYKKDGYVVGKLTVGMKCLDSSFRTMIKACNVVLEVQRGLAEPLRFEFATFEQFEA